MLKSVVALAALAATVLGGKGPIYPDHNILTHNVPMFVGRLDPIVNPGGVSAHVHTVIGASNFRCKLQPHP